MRMVFKYKDGTAFVAVGESEELCVYEASELTEEHGEITYYSEIEEDSLLYNE